MQKLIAFFMVAMIVGTGQSCQKQSGEQAISNLLEKEETRKMVYEEIVNDRERLQDFMDHMMQSRKTRGMMKNHPGMMHQMMGGKRSMKQMMKKDSGFRNTMMNSMVEMASKDSVFCRNLNRSMMNDQQVMPIMRQMMKRHGHMKNGGDRKENDQDGMMNE